MTEEKNAAVDAALERKKRAWRLAHKLITLGRAIPKNEGKDMLDVRTEEICKAMGKPDGAKLEEVREFVLEVVEFMQGYGMYIVCGCGYLSIMVSEAAHRELALEENREPTSFMPQSIDKYLEEYILNTENSNNRPVPQICDYQQDTPQKW